MMSNRDLRSFLDQVWETSKDIFEPTNFHVRLHWYTKIFVSFLVLYQCCFPNLEAWAEVQRQKTILLTAEHFLGDDFNPEEKNSRYLVSVLRFLPQIHYRSLRNIKVQENGTQKRRGMANSSTVILNRKNIPDSEFVAVFLHELGHVVDLGMLSSKRGPISTFNGVYESDPSVKFYGVAWDSEIQKKPLLSQSDFISGYGGTDPYEDFAESYNFYLLHGEEFRNRAKKNTAWAERYNFLKKSVFFGSEFNFSADFFQYPQYFFDTTVLSYNFDKFLAVIGFEELEADDERVRRQRRGKTRRTTNTSTRARRMRRSSLRKRLQSLLSLG